jgi:hypothetical protein
MVFTGAVPSHLGRRRPGVASTGIPGLGSAQILLTPPAELAAKWQLAISRGAHDGASVGHPTRVGRAGPWMRGRRRFILGTTLASRRWRP